MSQCRYLGELGRPRERQVRVFAIAPSSSPPPVAVTATIISGGAPPVTATRTDNVG